jgi:hypothetical protein
VLVLSAAVLVIVIDARDLGPWGGRAEVGHGMTRMITERGGRGWRAGVGPRKTRSTRKGKWPSHQSARR